MTTQTRTVRLKVSPEVARIVGPGAPRPLRLEAARGALPLSGKDLVTALFFLCHGADPEAKALALETFRVIPSAALMPVVENEETHPQLLDFIARWRIGEPEIIGTLAANPATQEATLIHLAGRAGEGVLQLLAGNESFCRNPAIVAAILTNPEAGEDLKAFLQEEEGADLESSDVPLPEEEATAAEEGENEEAEEEVAEEELNQSKYQMSLEMGVSEKIKMALTGDKEWRNIFLKDPNKLVSSAVMKNPRITDGEVLAVAKNKSTSEELIRLIHMNREWVKHYEVKKALVMHPRTPLPKALKYMNVLSEKDIKGLAKSRNVSQVIVNNARRMVLAKQKKS